MIIRPDYSEHPVFKSLITHLNYAWTSNGFVSHLAFDNWIFESDFRTLQVE
jgi:hypothetical protein